jgi:hypothetical protein
MKKLIVFLMFVASCGNVETTPDAGIDSALPDTSLDLALPDVKIPDSIIPDVKVMPDLGEHKCSPSGYYTFYVSVTENTCPSSIVKKTEWVNSAFMKSYYCILYFEDGYSILDDGKILYCAYYTEPKPTGIKQWAECVVYNVDKTVYCEFKFSAPFTEPKV